MQTSATVGIISPGPRSKFIQSFMSMFSSLLCLPVKRSDQLQ